MALPTPKLDDRTFQDIVTEARSKIPTYCPRWTDYNLSDPGVTLIELFAWMTDMLLYRLNQVPDKNYIKFIELIGTRLEPPRPATVKVTLRLSAPQPGPVVIHAGAEVATVRTETRDAVVFATDSDATILVPTLIQAFTSVDGVDYFDVMEELRNPYLETTVFEDIPRENNALYLGYRDDLSAHTLSLTIQSSIEGIGVNPNNPPLVWEYWDSEIGKWLPLRLETDTTGGLNTSGNVILHIPGTGGRRELSGRSAWWIRCRATAPLPGQGEYSRSPVIRNILTESLGYTVSASHSSQTVNEPLGEGDDSPGQTYQLQNIPVLSRLPSETVEVEIEHEGVYQAWQEVRDFADSGPDDPHFTCDSVTGEVQFGPSIKQASGEERQHGKIPPAGRHIRFSSYRSGGGVVGNVGKGTITVLKSSIPYVASVTNFEAAAGGLDAETLEHAKLRAPSLLRANVRAVTSDDYEHLALEASPAIARARCIQDSAATRKLPPGTVRLLLVPSVARNEGYLSENDLQVPASVRERVQSYLDERRMLATRLELAAPEYVWITVRLRARVKPSAAIRQVNAAIEAALCRYINPVSGGPTGGGWPFGGNLTLSDVYMALREVPGIDYIQEARLHPVVNDVRQEGSELITVPADGLVCSYRHEIVLTQ